MAELLRLTRKLLPNVAERKFITAMSNNNKDVLILNISGYINIIIKPNSETPNEVNLRKAKKVAAKLSNNLDIKLLDFNQSIINTVKKLLNVQLTNAQLKYGAIYHYEITKFKNLIDSNYKKPVSFTIEISVNDIRYKKTIIFISGLIKRI